MRMQASVTRKRTKLFLLPLHESAFVNTIIKAYSHYALCIVLESSRSRLIMIFVAAYLNAGNQNEYVGLSFGFFAFTLPEALTFAPSIRRNALVSGSLLDRH